MQDPKQGHPVATTDAASKPQPFDGQAFGQLLPPIQRALTHEGYKAPTAIQEQAIPGLLEGRDIIGIAQTGTGKTAAFVLPMLHRLAANKQGPAPKHPRALVLAPTRELAVQIADSCKAYGRYLRISGTMAYGGMPQFPQVRDLRRGKDILVATPGRLLDLMRQGHLFLDDVECFVLDEVDRMLDMGFIDDIRDVVKAMPAERQTLFFSATMPPKTEALAREMVTEPMRVEIVPEPLDTKRIQQRLLFVQQRNKLPLLLERIGALEEAKILVFTQKKIDAERVSEALWQAGLRSTAIHGDKTQRARDEALEGFKRNRFRILVATDVAARGLDVDDISHVINFDMPLDAETYMHRIGRTGRAGRSGHAESFSASGERNKLRSVERMLGESIDVVLDQPFHCNNAERAARPANARPTNRKDGRRKPVTQGKRKARQERPSGNRKDNARRKEPAYDASWIDAPKAKPANNVRSHGERTHKGKKHTAADKPQHKQRDARPAWQLLLEEEAKAKDRRRQRKSPHRNKPWEAMYS